MEARQTKLAIETGIQNFSLIINPEFRENKRNFVFFFFYRVDDIRETALEVEEKENSIDRQIYKQDS